MTTKVEVKTSIKINDDLNNDVQVGLDQNGDLELTQDNDSLCLTKDGSLALARVILQHHQVKFEPTFIAEVDYTR